MRAAKIPVYNLTSKVVNLTRKVVNLTSEVANLTSKVINLTNKVLLWHLKRISQVMLLETKPIQVPKANEKFILDQNYNDRRPARQDASPTLFWKPKTVPSFSEKSPDCIYP